MRKIITLLLFSALPFATVLSQSQSLESDTPAVPKNTPVRISGTVFEYADKTPLAGASVVVKGSNTGTATDANGNYYLDVQGPDALLMFQFIGFQPQEVAVGSRISIDIYLRKEVSELESVVVVGFGVQKKASVVGAIETLAPKQLQLGTNRSMSNNIAGQLSGVIGVQRTGEPGKDNADIWIRGMSTFSGSNAPLVLVDGVERSLNNMDPAEIESFSILKDASASAVYGVRGANGVIIINTKRGTIGDPRVSVRVEGAISQPTKLPSFIDAAAYMELMNNIALDGGASTMPFPADRINKTRTGYDPDLYPDVNWIDAITNDYAYNQRVNISVNGGSPRLRYSLVASVFNEKGIIARDENLSWDTSTKLSRYNVRSNVDVDLTKTTLLRVNIGGYMQTLNRPNHDNRDLFNVAFNTLPYVHPTIYSTGEIPIKEGNQNPWALATQTGFQRGFNTQLEALVAMEQDFKFITPGLKARLMFSFDSYSASAVVRGKSPTYYNTATGRDDDGNLILNVNRYGDAFLGLDRNLEYGTSNTYLEGQVTYSRAFGLHNVDAMLLYNQQSYDTGDKIPIRHQGLAGRFSYSYDRRYIGEFNFGYNGSENFAKGHRYGFFPSVAVGWLISEEKFMQSVKRTFNKIKIRASYGLAGNDLIERDGSRLRFGYISEIGSGNGYSWGTNGDIYYSGLEERQQGNTDLTWETVTKTDLGFELGMFNCIDLQIDLYKEFRKNIFVQRKNFPGSVGFLQMPYSNYGKVDKRGIDVALEFRKQINTNWMASARGTFTYATNTVAEIDEPLQVVGSYRSFTGHPIGTLSGYHALGLFTEDDFADLSTFTLKDGIPLPMFQNHVRPGDIRYADLNGDGYVNNEDQGPIGGTVIPEIVYGFGGLVRYRNIDLSVFLQGIANTYRIIGSNVFIPGSGGGVLGNVYSNYLDRWTPDNQSQDVFYPRLSNSTSANNMLPSTWWKKDMSFLRVKSIEVGYNFPDKWMKKIKIANARAFISGNNLFAFSGFKLWDPELDTGDGLIYPPMRTFSVGIDVTF